MEKIEKIYIFIIIFVNIFLLILHFVFIMCSKKDITLSNRYPILLLFVTLTIIILCDLHLLKAFFGNKIHHLIYFNLQNLSLLFCISIYTYRGIFIYLNNNKNKVLIFRSVFMLINLIFIFYIISINVFYYNIYFNSDSWQYYPLFIIYSSYLFIFHPFIIYLLNKKVNTDIKTDYIYSIIILSIGFLFEIISLFYYEINNFYDYEKIKNYIHFIATFLTCISYSLIPLIKCYINNKSSRFEETIIEDEKIIQLYKNKHINEN